MLFFKSLRRLTLTLVLATAFALVPLSVGLSAAATPSELPPPVEAIDVGPTPPDVGLPQEVTVEDGFEIGEPRQPNGSDGSQSQHDSESEAGSVDVTSPSTSSRHGVSETGNEPAAQRSAAVNSVPLARTGFSALAVAAFGGLSLVAGLSLGAQRPRSS